MTLQDISHYWGIIPILFSLFFFFQQKFSVVGRNRSNKLLGSYFLFLTITLACKYSIDLDSDWTLTAILVSPFLTFLAPLVYRYIHFLANENIQRSTRFNHWLHFFVPSFFLFVNVGFLISYIIFEEESQFVQIFLNLFEWMNITAFPYIGFGQVLVYSVWGFIYLRNYKKQLGNFSSFKEGLELKWLNTFAISFVTAALVFGVSKLQGGLVSFFYPAVLLHILYSGFYVVKRNFRLYKVSLEAEFRSKKDEKQVEDKEKKEQEEEKYKGSSLKDEERISAIKAEVLDLMMNHKVYLDPSLTVFKVGKELKVNSKYISQVINQEFNKNFISFVNEYRVKEVQEMMTESMYENLTLEGLALKAGFKSKSSFNIAFKKEFGITPSQYRKQLEEN